MPFKYAKVLVLGATSGIGWAMAKKFLDEGSSVIVVGRRQEKLDEFKSSFGKGGKVDTAVFDITDLKGIPQFVQNIISKHPDLDCVMLNSGIQRHLDWTKPESVDLDLMDLEFTTNYTSYMYLTKAFLPFFQKQQRESALVYVSSGLALTPIIYCPNYCASKAALHHMLLVMRSQLKDTHPNVKICELLPPSVQTELHDAKHQPEFGDKGRSIGMPLYEFVEEAYAGLNSDGNEQVPVQDVKSKWGFNGWEQERQAAFHKTAEMMKQQRH